MIAPGILISRSVICAQSVNGERTGGILRSTLCDHGEWTTQGSHMVSYGVRHTYLCSGCHEHRFEGAGHESHQLTSEVTGGAEDARIAKHSHATNCSCSACEIHCATSQLLSDAQAAARLEVLFLARDLRLLKSRRTTHAGVNEPAETSLQFLEPKGF